MTSSRSSNWAIVPRVTMPIAQEAMQKGYKKDYLVKTGLCYETDDHRLRDRFWGRVIFPVHTLSR